jgi:hypothetical protein
VAHDGLPTRMRMNELNDDLLVAAAPVHSEHLDVCAASQDVSGPVFRPRQP